MIKFVRSTRMVEHVVAVAQLAEHLTVDQDVEGSSPFSHPRIGEAPGVFEDIGSLCFGKRFPCFLLFTSVCNLVKVCSASYARMDKAYTNS